MWGNFVNHVINLLVHIIKLIKEKLNLQSICSNPQTPSPPSPAVDLETEYSAQSNTTAEGQSNNERPHYHPRPNNSDSSICWIQCSLTGVCVAAIGICVQAIQTSRVLTSMSFHWICIAMVCSLTAVLVSIYTPGDHKLLVVHVGIFIVFTALVVALVINIQLPFKVISIAVYLIGIFIIVSANLCKRKP